MAEEAQRSGESCLCITQLIATVCLREKQGQLELLQALLLIVCQHTSQLCKS